MPTPNQRETEKRKDRKAAARIIQSASVNTSFASYCTLFVLKTVDVAADGLDSPKANVFDQQDN
jgi:hypothetical protein